MCVVGIGVLCIHLYAELLPRPSHCATLVRPWFLSTPACAIVDIDCRSSNVSWAGTSSEYDAVVAQIDAASVQLVTFRHCPRVEISAWIAPLRGLIGVKTYNTTIVAWGEASALTDSNHPRVRFAYFLRTDFSDGSLPRGLVALDFPRFLLDLEFFVTNLASVPHDLPERWPPGIALYIASSNFTTFPLELARVQLSQLILDGNRLNGLPTAAFSTPFLTVAGNPIATLPSDVDTSSSPLSMLNIEGTNVSEAPLWMDAAFLGHATVFAAATPLCERVIAMQATPAATAVMAQRPWLANIICEPTGFVSPVDLEEASLLFM